MLKNFLFLGISVLLFLAIVLGYGSFLRQKEKRLSEILAEKNIEHISEPRIIVNTSSNLLALYNGNDLIKKYRISLGHSDFLLAKGTKKFITTPKGIFSVCDISRSNKYFISYSLTYPDSSYISEALRQGLISENAAAKMLELLNYGCSFDFNEKIFGPTLKIHGYGKGDFLLKNLPFVFNWSNGSIALSNEDITELKDYLKIGMKIIIN